MTKPSMTHLEAAVSEADHILERARLISEGAPYWMNSDDDFSKLSIEGEEAVLYWPEAESGYYNSCSIERQSVRFPAALLLMTVEEIGVWKVEQRRLYDANQKAKAERDAKARAEQQTAMELQTLAALKAKYGA